MESSPPPKDALPANEPDTSRSSTSNAQALKKEEAGEEHSAAGLGTTTLTDAQKLKPLAFLERFLALWIALAMAVGIILGYFVPRTAEVLDGVEFVHVSLPLSIALIVMMYPILCRVSPKAIIELFSTKSIWKHLLFSLVVNWVVAPLVMLALAWAFLPDNEGLREGLILVGLARCIAMVLVWTDIAHGDTTYCAVLVAFNSILQIALYSPLSILYLNVISSSSGAMVSYSLVAQSVAAFLGIPLAAAMLTRGAFQLFKQEKFFVTKFLPFIGPLSLIALLFTTIIIFAGQGRHVVKSITSVLRVTPPLIFYFLIMFALTLVILRKSKVGYERSVTQAFTAASNNFELAIAVALAVYGPNSSQALAATVGPLIEVPVLLGLAYLVLWWEGRRVKNAADEHTGSAEQQIDGEKNPV